MGAVLAWDAKAVIDMWKMHKSPFYAIFEGTPPKDTILYAQSEDDDNTAEERLTDTLTYIYDSGSSALFTLRIYNDGDKISNKKEYRGTIPFKLNQYDASTIGEKRRGRGEDTQQIVVVGDRRQPAPIPLSGNVEDKLSKLIEQNHLLLQHFILQKDEGEYPEDPEDPEDEPEISQQEKMLQEAERWVQLGTQVMSIPAVNGLVSTLLQRLAPSVGNNVQQTNFLPQNTQQMAAIGNVQDAPVTDKQVTDGITAIVSLIGEEKWRNALVLLGKMAQENPQQLQFLLSMLK